MLVSMLALTCPVLPQRRAREPLCHSEAVYNSPGLFTLTGFILMSELKLRLGFVWDLRATFPVVTALELFTRKR